MAGARRPQLPGKACVHVRSGHQGPQELGILPRELPPPALWRPRFQPSIQPDLVFPPRWAPRGLDLPLSFEEGAPGSSR